MICAQNYKKYFIFVGESYVQAKNMGPTVARMVPWLSGTIIDREYVTQELVESDDSSAQIV